MEFAYQCRGHGFDFWSRKTPHTSGQLSPCTTTSEPVLQSPYSGVKEGTAIRSPHTATKEDPHPPAAIRESLHSATETQGRKKKKIPQPQKGMVCKIYMGKKNTIQTDLPL